jgi:hypothetical protein
MKPRITTVPFGAKASSVPASHFGEIGPLMPHTIDDDGPLSPDAIPSSLHEEVLTPQELNRRNSQSFAPGNRRSSNFEDFGPSSPQSGPATPVSDRNGGRSHPNSPPPTKADPTWQNLSGLPDITTLNLTRKVQSSLRNPVLNPHPRVTSTPAQPVLKPKWAGHTAEKLFPANRNEASLESRGVKVSGVNWRRTGEAVTDEGRDLNEDEKARILQEEEGLEFSME